MQAIKCEMCGSTDFVKQDGLFVCQHCGVKYTVDEAKKFMVEIDMTKKLANLYERARKSLEVDDLTHAAEYYKQILDENPSDWEAYFYSYLGEFTTFTNAQASSVALKLGDTIPPAYDMAIADCDPAEAQERIKVMSNKVSARILGIATTAYNLMRQYEGGGFGPAGNVHRSLYSKMRPMAVNTVCACLDALNKVYDKVETIYKSETEMDKKALADVLLGISRIRYSIADHQYSPSLGVTERFIKREFLLKYAQAIKDFDPSFEMPPEQPQKTGGCYVATCVYGSYDCPQVWTLRRYRDDTLRETWYGRAFIKVYYAVSPTLVKWFGDTKWFKKMWKGKLDRMVARLQAEGVSDTPYYQDRA